MRILQLRLFGDFQLLYDGELVTTVNLLRQISGLLAGLPLSPPVARYRQPSGVVVEQQERSPGELVPKLRRQGRDVMAVPGSVLSGRNRGSHALLKDGAKVVETADDILEDLGWSPSTATRGTGLRAPSKALSADPLLSKMDAGEVYRLDDLVEATGTAASKLLPRLMELERAVAHLSDKAHICAELSRLTGHRLAVQSDEPAVSEVSEDRLAPRV